MSKEEHESLSEDCSEILNLIMKIPGTLFENDIEAYLDLLGYDSGEKQLLMSFHDFSSSDCWFSRADLIESEEGFKLIEFNVDSSVGGMETGQLSRIIQGLYEQKLKDYHFLDPYEGMIKEFEELFSKLGWKKEEKTIGIIDWYPDMLEYLQDHKNLARILMENGFNPVICHQENMIKKGNELYLGDRKIDILYKFFLLSDAKKSISHLTDLLHPVHTSDVRMINSLYTDIYSNKGNLALLWDARYFKTLPVVQQNLVKRYIPWTNFFTPKSTIVHRGSLISLKDFVCNNKDSLVLKPIKGYGGNGVILGWTVSPEEWKAEIEIIMNRDEPYIVQERVESIPKELPYVKDEKVEWLDTDLNFGLLLCKNAPNGLFVRGVPKEANTLTNINKGASIGTALIKKI
ncbi:glutathionylspermidine synthase family protein [Bacillus sp. RO3]|nr:glutathionylspermidine synthase family protein [Bacillus sp. RO3]